jgi:hypothetical protein
MPFGAARTAILAGVLLGALLLVVAEFTELYRVDIASSPTTVRMVDAGGNHGYALLPLALLAAVLGIGVYRSGSRPALLAIGLVGLVALLITLLGDLPDAQGSHLIRLSGSFFNTSSTPSAGLYLETLGAVLLIATCVLGFLGLGRPERHPPPGRLRASDPGSSRGERSPSTRGGS